MRHESSSLGPFAEALSSFGAGHESALLRLVHAASRPYVDFLLGDAAAETLAEWMQRASSEVALQRARPHFEGGELVGLTITHERDALLKARLADVVALRRAPLSPALRERLDERLRATRALWPAVPADALYLSRIAVLRTRRRRGVGARLLEAVIAEARERGLARVSLDVSADNAAAIALYERHAFETLSRHEAEAGGERIAYQRMERAL